MERQSPRIMLLAMALISELKEPLMSAEFCPGAASVSAVLRMAPTSIPALSPLPVTSPATISILQAAAPFYAPWKFTIGDSPSTRRRASRCGMNQTSTTRSGR